MGYLMSLTRRRFARLLGVCALLAGGIGASVLLTAGTAGATSCDAGTDCTITGTAGLTGGTLNLTTSSSLAWSTTLTGLTQHIVDTTTADKTYVVNDATGSGAGWNVTVGATTFTTGTDTLADAGTFSTNGSIASAAATTSPGAVCTGGAGTCTLPDNTATSYPVAITTDALSPTPSTVYQAAAASGLGSISIGTVTPVGWWINLPGTTLAGTYTSTVTLDVVSGP